MPPGPPSLTVLLINICFIIRALAIPLPAYDPPCTLTFNDFTCDTLGGNTPVSILHSSRAGECHDLPFPLTALTIYPSCHGNGAVASVKVWQEAGCKGGTSRSFNATAAGGCHNPDFWFASVRLES